MADLRRLQRLLANAGCRTMGRLHVLGELSYSPIFGMLGSEPMVVTEREASTFIDGYTKIMVQIFGSHPAKSDMTLLAVLAKARSKYSADRSLLDAALLELEEKSVLVAPEVVYAVQRLVLKQWIYLKDTNSHSIFIDPSGDVAYGVLGLNDRIRGIVGGSGAIVETGVLPFHGRYVSDGILSNLVWLGPNYKKDFSSLLRQIRAKSKFHKTYTPL
jgi:hypothetical protein